MEVALKEETGTRTNQHKPKLWMPKQVLITPAALEEPWGQQIYERVQTLGLPVQELKNNRITGLRGEDERETYRNAKSTLAIVTAPPSALKLQPIPPSADWQFHLAEGCPAHCQYCYLAGSLQGPPVIRAFANLPAILSNLVNYKRQQDLTTFEASCYTDPLGIEHLTGSLAETIRFFGEQENMHLRWVSKFDQVDGLLSLPHHGNTQPRISLNTDFISKRMEGGTASMEARLAAIRKLAFPKTEGGGGYKVGLVIAPIMPVPDWEEQYTHLLDRLEQTLDFPCEITFELISHRFTPGSKALLQEWYPNTQIDFDEANRSLKYNKFGGKKYVYNTATMNMLRSFFYSELKNRFPEAPVLYWT
ncbi:spore photoproduct lyase family protein [Pontibacter sp. SGAir0037]|uniref:spore photoproduct lyase family protein n=1 Tax=Pontibacter sp. SGAir0037 TaxID=2571030 RepID=UPI0010CD1C82|nr:radical SAM protein [Pontibacter sp. SGAir0037]QCR21801.1 radical SAM protein [Pontibacter sp. SGAir0037]